MGYTSPKGLPIPFGSDGNNVPADLLAFAQRLDDILSPHTYAQISAMGGVDLWDGRVMFQSDTGVLRPWIGLYCYRQSLGSWEALIPVGAPAAYSPLWTNSISPPTFGGTVSQGRYARFGSFIMGDFIAQLPVSGYSAGAGTMLAPLPVPAHLNGSLDGPPCGMMCSFDSSATNTRNATLVVNSTDPTTMFPGQPGSVFSIQGISSSFGFANSDLVTGFFFYEGTES